MAEFNYKTFLGGVSDDPDNVTSVSFAALRGFNLDVSNYKLVPERSMEADEDKTFTITKFLQASDGEFYGFGVGTGGDAGKMQVYIKDDPITGNWATATGGVSTANGTIGGALGSYKDNVYGIWGNTKVFQWGDITGIPTFTDSFGTLSASSNGCKPEIGGDDEYYFGHNNFLAQINSSGTFTEKKLTLPSEYTITGLAKWGSYFAIAAAGDSIVTNSTLFLWNYIDADPSLSVDFGKEDLLAMGNVDGNIIGVSLSDNDTNINFKQTMVVKIWNGGEVASELWNREMPGTLGWSIDREHFTENGNLYFLLNINSNAAAAIDKGVWSVGRKNENFPWRLSQKVKGIDDTIVTVFNGWYKLGDYWWYAHSSDGSVERTNNDSAYTATSIVETELLSADDDPTKTGRVQAVLASFEELPAGATVKILFKADGDTSWTEIASEATDDATILESTDTVAGQLPTEWRSIQFRVESVGATLTGIRVKYDPMSTEAD